MNIKTCELDRERVKGASKGVDRCEVGNPCYHILQFFYVLSVMREKNEIIYDIVIKFSFPSVQWSASIQINENDCGDS